MTIYEALDAENGSAVDIRGKVVRVTPAKPGNENQNVTHHGVSQSGKPWSYIGFVLAEGDCEITVQWWYPTAALDALVGKAVRVAGVGKDAALLKRETFKDTEKVFIEARGKAVHPTTVDGAIIVDSQEPADPPPADRRPVVPLYPVVMPCAVSPAPAEKRGPGRPPGAKAAPTPKPEPTPEPTTETKAPPVAKPEPKPDTTVKYSIRLDERGRLSLASIAYLIRSFAPIASEAYRRSDGTVDPAAVAATVNTILIAATNGKLVD